MGNEQHVDKRFRGSASTPVRGSTFGDLPLVKDRYQPVSILGQGAFGCVLKILDVTTSHFYAMKFFCLEVQESYLSEAEQKDMIESGMAELQLLKTISESCTNVIQFHDSFTINRSPLNDVRDVSYLCLVMEFCNGGNLNDLLQKYDARHAKIPRDLALGWFLTLAKTLHMLHEDYKLIHRDLKPDNLLFTLYSDPDTATPGGSGRQMYLDDIETIKICDFGVGKILKDGERARLIKGHMFYTAPEVLSPPPDLIKLGGYDSRCDMYSLGIIFFQLYKSICQEKYELLVEKFQERIPGDADVPFYELVVQAHTANYIQDTIIKNNVRDLGVRHVLNLMICPFQKRLFAVDLLKEPIIRTWMYILLGEECVTPVRGKPIRQNFSITGTVTCLKIRNNLEIFNTVMKVLRTIFMDSEKVPFFVRSQGSKALIKCVASFRDHETKKGLLRRIIATLIFILKSYGGRNAVLLGQMSDYLRRYGLIQILKELVLGQDVKEVYFFLLLLLNHTDSWAFYFLDCVMDLMAKVTDRNRVLVCRILEAVLPFLKRDEALGFVHGFRLRTLFFLKALPCKDDPDVSAMVYRRIVDNLRVYTKRNDLGGIMSMLKLAVFFSYDFANFLSERKHTLKLQFSMQPSIETGLGLIESELYSSKLIIDPRLSTRFFYFSGGIKKHEIIELLSSEPVCRIRINMRAEETAICFYEFFVKDSSCSDDLTLGFQDEQREVVCDCRKGLLRIGDSDTVKMPSVTCMTGSMIGVGVTNHGRFFLTYNNRIVKFAPVYHPRDNGTVLFALMKVFAHQTNLKGYVNFGKRAFMFTFGNDTKERHTILMAGLNQVKQMRQQLETIRHRYSQSHPKIVHLCSVLLNFRNFNFAQNADLVKEYESRRIQPLALRDFNLDLEPQRKFTQTN